MTDILLVLLLFKASLGFEIQKGGKKIATNAGVDYYLGEDKRTIIALETRETIWVANVIDVCGRPPIGKPEIRNVKLIDKMFEVTYGKHSLARVDIKTGKIECLGSDGYSCLKGATHSWAKGASIPE
ncbi:MAG TPA: hypothetical protein VD908_01560 [Cytophagales bacterium]|nr:hypothetical protein [Cytophagales bacterium]